MKREEYVRDEIPIFLDGWDKGYADAKEEILEKIDGERKKLEGLWSKAVDKGDESFKDMTWHTLTYFKELQKAIKHKRSER